MKPLTMEMTLMMMVLTIMMAMMMMMMMNGEEWRYKAQDP